LYGDTKNKYGLQGQTLHAYLIGFHHPRDGRYIELTAPIPAYFTELLERLR
jgi:23S rRNA pseudouridine1911/1915/1917 synthase